MDERYTAPAKYNNDRNDDEGGYEDEDINGVGDSENGFDDGHTALAISDT